jgi:hypothetical protein
MTSVPTVIYTPFLPNSFPLIFPISTALPRQCTPPPGERLNPSVTLTPPPTRKGYEGDDGRDGRKAYEADEGHERNPDPQDERGAAWGRKKSQKVS